MSAAVDVAPLLIPYRDRDRGSSNEIQSLVPSVPSNGPGASTPSQRLASLDVFRGLTVAVRQATDKFLICFHFNFELIWLVIL